MNTPRMPVRLLFTALSLSLIPVTASAAAADAPTPTIAKPAPGTYALKDGNTLSVATNGWMRMFSSSGSHVYMKDGVAMETREGQVIVMKEDLNWRDLRRFGTLNPKFR